MAQRGYRRIKVEFKGTDVNVYTSARTADALEEITKDMTLYHGVRLAQVMEAVYYQGRKDGAHEPFQELEVGHESSPLGSTSRPSWTTAGSELSHLKRLGRSRDVGN